MDDLAVRLLHPVLGKAYTQRVCDKVASNKIPMSDVEKAFQFARASNAPKSYSIRIVGNIDRVT